MAFLEVLEHGATLMSEIIFTIKNCNGNISHFFLQIITTYQYVKCLVKEIRFEKFVFILKRVKLKIKCVGPQNSNQHLSGIFGSFGTRSNFDVGEHFYKKKLWKVNFLTFEGEV